MSKKIWGKDDFKARQGKVLVDRVDVPGQDAEAYVRGMSGTGRGEFEKSLMEGKGKSREMNLKRFRGELLSRTASDQDGNLLFAPEDAAWLGELPAMETEPLVDRAMKLSGIGEQDREELVGN